jgi:hypothetical protein
MYHSDYFRKALQKCWKESDERNIVIDDLESALFSVFVDWLYTGQIPLITTDWELMSIQACRDARCNGTVFASEPRYL